MGEGRLQDVSKSGLAMKDIIQVFLQTGVKDIPISEKEGGGGTENWSRWGVARHAN